MKLVQCVISMILGALFATTVLYVAYLLAPNPVRPVAVVCQLQSGGPLVCTIVYSDSKLLKPRPTPTPEEAEPDLEDLIQKSEQWKGLEL